MRVYLDSSAFAKRFLEEAGSDAVERICAEAEALGLSVICVPEVVSALSRRRRERDITATQYATAKQTLLADVRDAELVQLTEPVVLSAVAILEGNAVRTLDAMHIACALEWEAEVFVSSDRRQLTAARGVGLQTRAV